MYGVAQMENIEFLHVVCADTKNTYGIMSQIHKRQDMSKHRFLITASESCKERFPKLYEFDDNIFMPGGNYITRKVKSVLFFYRMLASAKNIVWHSLFFGTQRYIWLIYFYRRFLKKSIWIEWGADLYNWTFPNNTLRNRIKNYVNKKIRSSFNKVGLIFPVDKEEYIKQFGDRAKFFYTPMPNPRKGDSELIEYIYSLKPRENRNKKIVQIGHNAFTFNNHFYLFDILKQYKNEDVIFFLPISYGIYGINGQYGSKKYYDAVRRFARKLFGKKILIHTENIPFDDYISLLWNIDVAVFDFDRPCGLGTIRILALMEKKIFLPSGTPFYDFLQSIGIPVCDTKRIQDMSYEEFVAPVRYRDNSWIKSYLNNGSVMEHWNNMFEQISLESYS